MPGQMHRLMKTEHVRRRVGGKSLIGDSGLALQRLMIDGVQLRDESRV